MAQTLASGVVIPAPGDRISASGVQEMRTLGASVDTGLSAAQAQTAQVDAQSRARDADLADQVAGMEGMTYVGAWESGRTYRINDVVAHGGDSWARLTAGSAGEPGASPTDWGLVARKGDGGGFGELSETAVPGLWEGVDAGIEARIAAVEYDSGRRNVSSLIGTTVTGVFLQRVGRLVIWEFVGALFAAGGWRTLCTVPAGFRPIGEVLDVAHGASSLSALDGTRGSVRITTTLTADVTTGPRYRMRASYFTADPIPTTLPGTPA